jgi:uncharacterized protein (TIGR03086 family)
MTEISDRYRAFAEGFTSRVEAVPVGDTRWQGRSPCDEWDAAGVVAHMVDTHRLFLGFVDEELPPGPDAAADPHGAWAHASGALHAALADPGIARRTHEGMFGVQPWQESVDRFITPDVLLHSWDLARALGIDDTLDPDEVHLAFETAKGYPADAMRGQGVFGPEVEVADDASEQDRLLAFTGRDPS